RAPTCWRTELYARPPSCRHRRSARPRRVEPAPPRLVPFRGEAMTGMTDGTDSVGLEPNQGLDLLVEGGTVVTVDAQRRILTDASVGIRDGRIVAVIQRDRLPASV